MRIAFLFGQPGFSVHLRISPRKSTRQLFRSILGDVVVFEAWYSSSGSGSEIVGTVTGAMALDEVVSATEGIGVGHTGSETYSILSSQASIED